MKEKNLYQKLIESGVTFVEFIDIDKHGNAEVRMRKIVGIDHIKTTIRVHNDGTAEIHEDEEKKV